MNLRVSNATPLQLDWLVAKCEGKNGVLHDDGITRCIVIAAASGVYKGTFKPTVNWSLGGPILSEARISRTIDHSGLWVAYWTDGYGEGDDDKKWMQCDRSELVAGLRCYVVSKLGGEVEVPEELL
jgi:hypothetical protein